MSKTGRSMNSPLRYFIVSSVAAAAVLSLSAVTLVSPKEGETTCLLNDGNKAFLSMDAAARRKIFTDKAWRHEAAKKWRSLPKPVIFFTSSITLHSLGFST